MKKNIDTNDQTDRQTTMSPLGTSLIELSNVLTQMGEEPYLSDDAMVSAVTKKLKELDAVLKNSAIVISHTVGVFQSMAERGVYPDELVEGKPTFKGRQGFQHLLIVLQQVLSVLPKQESLAKSSEASNADKSV